MWQKDMVNRLKFIQTIIDNYRQLQMQIKGKQVYKYNYRDKYIAIYRTQLQQISHKNTQKTARF